MGGWRRSLSCEEIEWLMVAVTFSSLILRRRWAQDLDRRELGAGRGCYLLPAFPHFSERVTMHGQFFWLDVATSDVVASRVVN